MNFRPGGRLPILVGIVAALVWAALLSVPHLLGHRNPADRLEPALLDLRYFLDGPREPPSDIVIVAVDDDTLSRDDPEAGRARLARLVRNIHESGARTLVIDVLFAGSEDPESDRTLADALAMIPTVIAAAGSFGSETADTAIPQVGSALLPQGQLREVAETGFVNLSVDHRGTPRHVPMIFDHQGEIVPSLTLVAASHFTRSTPQLADERATLGATGIDLDAGFHLPIRYLGPSGTIRTVSAGELLDGPRPDLLSGKLAVLGFTAAATGDRFTTPFDESMPGVEVIATAIAQLLGGPGLARTSEIRLWDTAMAIGLAGICTALVLAVPLSIGAPVALTVLLAGLATVWGAFTAGVWMSAALPLAAAVPPAALAGIWRYASERRSARATENAVAALRKFHSPLLAHRLVEDPDFLSSPISRDLVILFVDLTGFTRISQILGPEETQRFLKDFHGHVAKSVEDNGGSVMDFMGDGAFAVFGIETGTPASPADAALQAAFAILGPIPKMAAARVPDAEVGCRIGLHSGPVVLSRLGAESHLQLAATGDSVNLASRLMEVAKTERAAIAASGTFVGGIGGSTATSEATRKTVAIRGRAGDVEVYLWAAPGKQSRDSKGRFSA